jgi:hypothetical protein
MHYLPLFLLFLIISVFSRSQSLSIQRETIGSGGISVSTADFKIQTSVGQASIVANETNNSNYHLSQGFQKAILRKKSMNNWEIVAFPNPNNGTFSFTTTLPSNEKISYEVLDIQGKLICTNEGLGGENISINLNKTSDGLYFLKVKTHHTFSTIKIEVFQ